MSVPVRLIIVEDVDSDADLALRALVRGGFSPTALRVKEGAQLDAALAQGGWDAVISDFSLPGFSGLDALAMVRARDASLPFILVSGAIGEEAAVEAMRAGANDFIAKQNLARLAPALDRSISDARLRGRHDRVQRDLAESERRFRSMLQNIQLAAVMLDREARVTYCNEHFLRLTGWGAGEVIGSDYFENFIPAGERGRRHAYADLLSGSERHWYRENHLLMRSGATRAMCWSNTVLLSPAGNPIGVASIGEDITARKAAEERVLYLSRVHAVRSEINALIMRVGSLEELFGGACEIAVSRGRFNMAWIGTIDTAANRLEPVASAGMPADLMAAIEARLASGAGALSGETAVARAFASKGAVISLDLASNPAIVLAERHRQAGNRSMAMLPLFVGEKPVGAMTLYSGHPGDFDAEGMMLLGELARDIAYAIDHIRKQQQLDYLAYYDPLTGLANRTLFLERLSLALQVAAGGGHKVALYLIDIERFKNINDSFGRQAGDTLLQQIAAWMTGHVRDAQLLARLDADHFALFLPKFQRDADVTRFLEESIAAFLEQSFRIGEVDVRIAAKGGIALFPDDARDADTLFRNAEAALKKAKSGGQRYLFYTQKMTDAVSARVRMEGKLKRALEKGEFELHYQPKVSLSSGRMTSAECLIRWNDPEAGLVSPAQFVPILEETGLIKEAGEWALKCAVQNFLRARRAGLAAVRLAVNVSPLQLHDPDFPAVVRRAIGIDEAARDGLELEITESLIMQDVGRSIDALCQIREMGITIAIDDFGTGFSSLNYLSKLPVDTLKIDRSFIIQMTDDPDGLALVSTIVNLGKALKLKVVAEGVETEDQARLLRQLGCDEMQGYLFSKPEPLALFEKRLLDRGASSDRDTGYDGAGDGGQA